MGGAGGGDGGGGLLDAGGDRVDVVAGRHGAGGGQGLQGRHLPLGGRRLAVHRGGGRAVAALHCDCHRRRRGWVEQRLKRKFA